MAIWRWLIIGLLVLLCLGACTAVPDPTPTPVQNVAEVATLVVERPSATPLPTLTPTLQPSTTPEPSVTNTATPTQEVIASPTNTPMPSRTPSTDEDPLWQENLQAVYVETTGVLWSPVANEMVFDTCIDIHQGLDLNGDIITAVAPMFDPQKISPLEFICNYQAMSGMIWTPDGQKIFFGGPYADLRPEPYLDEYAQVWVMDRDGRNANPIGNANDRWLGLAGWIDENTLIYSGYAGGGHIHIALLDILSGESFASTIVHSGGVYHVNDAYIGTQNGWDSAFNITAAVISRIPQELEDDEVDELFNPFLYSLSSDFSSRYEDWLSNTNSMLVLTWEKELELWGIDLLHDPAVTQLQLWNVDMGDLTLLVSEAIRGQFSPDGRFLAYVTPGIPSPSIHLLPEMGSGSILSLPLAAKQVGESSSQYNFYFSFAPNGRYFTFLTPGIVQVDSEGKPIGVDYQPDNIHVNLFDMDSQQFLASLSAQEFVPVWSPDNGRFLYQDQFGTLALYTLADNTAFPLTQTPDARLTNPHWSFDGSYLSVTVRGGSVVKTAVLSIP